MIFELILKFFWNRKSSTWVERLRHFIRFPKSLLSFKTYIQRQNIEKTPEDSEELGIYIKRKDANRIFIPIRESQKSGYFLIEVPSESSLR
jgi:hypothetical protein